MTTLSPSDEVFFAGFAFSPATWEGEMCKTPLNLPDGCEGAILLDWPLAISGARRRLQIIGSDTPPS